MNNAIIERKAMNNLSIQMINKINKIYEDRFWYSVGVKLYFSLKHFEK